MKDPLTSLQNLRELEEKEVENRLETNIPRDLPHFSLEVAL